jgi:hypothetical protein
MESVHMPKFMDSGTFGLGTTSLNWQTIQSDILKEFYSNFKLFSIHIQVLSQDGYIEAGCVWQFEGMLFIVLAFSQLLPDSPWLVASYFHRRVLEFVWMTITLVWRACQYLTEGVRLMAV